MPTPLSSGPPDALQNYHWRSERPEPLHDVFGLCFFPPQPVVSSHLLCPVSPTIPNPRSIFRTAPPDNMSSGHFPLRSTASSSDAFFVFLLRLVVNVPCLLATVNSPPSVFPLRSPIPVPGSPPSDRTLRRRLPLSHPSTLFRPRLRSPSPFLPCPFFRRKM